MKTVYINNLYHPYTRGGAERVVHERARADTVRGDQAVVISWKPWSGWGSWDPERTVEDGIVVYRYWVPNLFSYWNLGKYPTWIKLAWHKIDILNGWSGRIVKNILKLEDPDVVHTHNLMGIGFSIPRVIRQLDLVHHHTIHDVQLVEPSGVLPWDHTDDSALQKFYSALMRWRFGSPDTVFAPTAFLKRFYTQRGFFKKSKWVISEHEHHYHADQSKGSTQLLFVGQLNTHKGLRMLMDAWDALPKDVHLLLRIVGDGPMHDEIVRWSQRDGRVRVYGRLDQDALQDVYHQSDVLVFPSICIENSPNVLKEAMSHGLKIIASDTGGVRETLGPYPSILIRPADVHTLSQAMTR